MNASDPDGNAISCQCVDSDQDGTCDTPVTCLADPDLTSCTTNPEPEVTPVSRCGGSAAFLQPPIAWAYRRRRRRASAAA